MPPPRLDPASPEFRRLVELEKTRMLSEARREKAQAGSAKKAVREEIRAEAQADSALRRDQVVLQEAEERKRTGAAPGEPGEVTEVLTRPELDDVAKRTGGVIRAVSGGLQVQDKDTGLALAQLHPGANIRLSDWWDKAEGAKEKAMLFPALPVTGVVGGALKKGEYDSSYGAREGFMDLAEKAGREYPRLTAGAAALASAPAVTADLMGAGFNKVQQGYRNLMAADYERMGVPELAAEYRARAAEDEQEGKQWARDALKAAADVRGGWDAATSDITPAEGARRGREILGVRGSDVASVFSPLDSTTLALKGVSKGVKAAAKSPMAREVGRAVERMAEGGSGGEKPSLVSTLPAAVGAPLESRALMKDVQSGAREFANVKMQEVMDALQVGTPEQRKLAIQAWNDPAARRAAVAADPGMADVFRQAQKRHAAMWAEDFGTAKDAQYNPFHVYTGQDYSEGARKSVSASAIEDPAQLAEIRRLAEKAGLPVDQLQLGKSRAVSAPDLPLEKGVPGLEVFDDPAVAGAFPIRARVADSQAQRALNKIASEVNARYERGGEGRIAAAVDRFKNPDDADIVHMARSLMDHDVASGMAESYRQARAADPKRWMMAARRILDSEEAVSTARRDYGPMAFTPAKDFLARVAAEAPEEADTLYKVLNAYGDEVVSSKGGMLPGPKTRRALAENDMVLLLPSREALGEGITAAPSTAYNRGIRVVALPGVKEARVVPRRYALTALQLKNGLGDQEVLKYTSFLDQLLGSAQFNQGVTMGNAGFTARNLTAATMRGLIDQGAEFMSSERRQATAQALANPEMRRELMARLGIGKDIGSRMDQFDVTPRAPKLLPAAVRPGAEKIFNAAMVPGKVVNEAVDAGYSRAMFGQLPPGIKADDAIRAHHYLNQLREGVNPNVAALNTNQLFINYADKSGAEKMLRTSMPFVRFYTGVFQGALGLAMKHPYRFSRLYALANYVRASDSRTDEQGRRTGINRKLVTGRDLAAGVPMVRTGPGQALALRGETPATESLALWDALPGTGAASDRRAGSLLGPAMTWPVRMLAPDAYEGMTGYRAMNVGSNTWDPTWGPLPFRYAQLMTDVDQSDYMAGAVADSPRGALTWDMLRGMAGPLPTGWADPFARYVTGATGYQSRTPEDADTALMRALLRQTSGFRTEPVRLQDALSRLNNRPDRMPMTVEQMKVRGAR